MRIASLWLGRLGSPVTRQALVTALVGGGTNNTAASEDSICHIEVIEYCDLGNLTHAIRHQASELCDPNVVGICGCF